MALPSKYESREVDAYRHARVVVEGRQHIPPARCKCETPFWLRESSSAERRREYVPPITLTRDDE